MEDHLVAGVMVDGGCYFLIDLYGEAGFFKKLADNGLFRSLPFFEPAAGEFPEAAPDIIGQPLLDK